MSRSIIASIIISFVLALSCSNKQVDTVVRDDNKITLAIIQLNDVYEISGVSGGALGNLARVQGFYDSISTIYPNTMMVHAGDFLNPSLINTMKYEGERIRGRQMIETMNAMSFDAVAFGNHEFDLDEVDFRKRLNESEFPWVATNLGYVCGSETFPLFRESGGVKQFFPRYIIREVQDRDGSTLRVGIFSATLPDNQRDYVVYFDADSCARRALHEIDSMSDVQIGLTHLNISDDLKFAATESKVDLILGGHDHDNMYHQVGKTIVTKADANAKTVYLHILNYNSKRDKLKIKSELVEINDRIPKNKRVSKIINKWEKILQEEVGAVIENPYEVVYRTNEPLDGRESSIRHHQTNLGTLITNAMLSASAHEAEAAILNSGAIRIDDQLSGNIAAMDVFRILPFGGSIVDVEISGELFREVLNFSLKNQGTGAYLQRSNIGEVDNHGGWTIRGKAIQPDKNYKIVINDFLLTGYDIPMLKEGSPGIITVNRPSDPADPRSDMRVAIISALKNGG